MVGAAGGRISGRRKKREEEEQEQEKVATVSLSRLKDLVGALSSKVKWTAFDELPTEYGFGKQQILQDGYKIWDDAKITQAPRTLFRWHDHPDPWRNLPWGTNTHFATPTLINAANYAGGVGIKAENTAGKVLQEKFAPIREALLPLTGERRGGFLSQFRAHPSNRYSPDYGISNGHRGWSTDELITRGFSTREAHETALSQTLNPLIATGGFRVAPSNLSRFPQVGKDIGYEFGGLSGHPEWSQIGDEVHRLLGKSAAAQDLQPSSYIPDDALESVRPHPALPALLQAQAHSDKKDYRQKNILIRKMMNEKPDDWVVDSDDGKGIVGVTHTPTGFKLHMRKDRVSPRVS